MALGERAVLCCTNAPPCRRYRTSNFSSIWFVWNFAKCFGGIADRLDSDCCWERAGSSAYQDWDPPGRMATSLHPHRNVRRGWRVSGLGVGRQARLSCARTSFRSLADRDVRSGHGPCCFGDVVDAHGSLGARTPNRESDDSSGEHGQRRRRTQRSVFP